jgi:hypothetical protein
MVEAQAQHVRATNGKSLIMFTASIERGPLLAHQLVHPRHPSVLLGRARVAYLPYVETACELMTRQRLELLNDVAGEVLIGFGKFSQF